MTDPVSLKVMSDTGRQIVPISGLHKQGHTHLKSWGKKKDTRQYGMQDEVIKADKAMECRNDNNRYEEWTGGEADTYQALS